MLKKKYALVVVCSALLMASLPSCKKWIDLKPTDGIIRENFWQTKEQIKASVIGCYASLLGDLAGSGDRSLAETLFLWGELRGDMLATSLGTIDEELQIMNVNTVSSNRIVKWNALYKTINYCNTVIDFAPGVMEVDKTLSQSVLDSYVAEAKGLRALMYFYLVRSFGDVPLKLKSTSSDEEIAPIAKSTQQQVLTQIIADLADAEPKALLTYGDQASDKGRITRYTINTIQADVYLWNEKYAEAIVACDKVINARKFGLISGTGTFFNTLYRNGNSNESIFEFQFDKQKTNTFFNLLAIGSRHFIAANKVADQVFTTDQSGFLRDARAAGVSFRAEDNVVWKYVGQNNEDLIATTADSYTHWFVYRYADILLMKAEALAETGKGVDALALVKTVRDRAQALPGTDLNPDPNNKNDVALFILQERSREFMFEGKRWYDVLRYTKKNNYANIAYLQDLVSQTVPASSVRIAQAKMLDHNSHYFPIFDYELQTNKALVQNPFYK